MKKITQFLFLLVATTATLFSCAEKIDELKDSTDTTNTVASLNIEAANALDIQTGIENNTDSETNLKKAFAPSPSCAVITVVNATYPKEITVDYGSGCTINSITRKGKLKITITAPIDQSGSIMTVERIDYYINGNKLEGTIEYENTTAINSIVPQWTRTVTDGKFTNTNGKVFLNSGNCTVSQTAGVGTTSLNDNTYEMTGGSHTVKNEAGNTLTLTVTETLVKNYICEYISKGKLKIEGGLLSGVVDYGTGTCDNNYTFTHKNGSVFELKIQ